MKISPEVKTGIIVIAVVLSIWGFTSAMAEMFPQRNPRQNCTYVSIADFFPIRTITCEIFKQRWAP